jgi:hypothetical protein
MPLVLFDADPEVRMGLRISTRAGGGGAWVGAVCELR